MRGFPLDPAARVALTASSWFKKGHSSGVLDHGHPTSHPCGAPAVRCWIWGILPALYSLSAYHPGLGVPAVRARTGSVSLINGRKKLATALNPSAFPGEYPSKTVNIGVTEQAIFQSGEFTT